MQGQHQGQQFIVHLNELERVGGDVTVRSGHGSHSVALVEHLRVGQDVFSAIIRALPCSWAKSIPPCAMMGKSAAVATARTPGRASAWLVLMERIRAWAWGLRRIMPCSIPGNWISAL